MKKKIIAVLSLLIIIALLPQVNGSAQDAVSQAEVEFLPGEGPTYPVDPEDPENPGNSGEAEGDFLIVSVTPLEFGTAKISATEQQYDTTTFQPNIQVVDLRGTAAGWNVTAKVSRFTDGPNLTLPGSEIRIISGRPKSLSVADEPEQIENVRIPTDETPTRVITSSAGSGMGHWVMRWYPPTDTGEYIKLRVLAGTATKGSHIARIDWVLGNTP